MKYYYLFILLSILSSCFLNENDSNLNNKKKQFRIYTTPTFNQFRILEDTIKINGEFSCTTQCVILYREKTIQPIYQDSSTIKFILPPHSLPSVFSLDLSDTILIGYLINPIYWQYPDYIPNYFSNYGLPIDNYYEVSRLKNCQNYNDTIFCQSIYLDNNGIYFNIPGTNLGWRLYHNSNKFGYNRSGSMKIVGNHKFIYSDYNINIQTTSGWEIMTYNKILDSSFGDIFESTSGIHLFRNGTNKGSWTIWDLDSGTNNWTEKYEFTDTSMTRPINFINCNKELFIGEYDFKQSLNIFALNSTNNKFVHVGEFKIPYNKGGNYEFSCHEDNGIYLMTYSHLYHITNQNTFIEIQNSVFFKNDSIPDISSTFPIRSVVPYKDMMLAIGQYIAVKKGGVWSVYEPSLIEVEGNFGIMTSKMLGYRKPFWADPKGYLWSDSYENFSEFEYLQLNKIGL